VVEPTQLKNMLVTLNHFPILRGENKTYLSCHHLDFFFDLLKGCWKKSPNGGLMAMNPMVESGKKTQFQIQITIETYGSPPSYISLV